MDKETGETHVDFPGRTLVEPTGLEPVTSTMPR